MDAKLGRTDVWLTPPHVIKDLGPFDLDPCAAPEPRPWPTATRHIVEAEDGLSQAWSGFCWVNPPYGKQSGKWLAHLADHNQGIGCVFARVETDWFFKTAWERGAGLLFLRGRLRFCTPDGEPTRSGVAPTVLVGYGDEALRRLANSSLKGHLTVSAAAMLVSGGKPIGTWQDAVAAAMDGRTLRLRDIYAAAEGTAKVREAKMRGHNWQAQVRRALQEYFQPVKTAVWRPA